MAIFPIFAAATKRSSLGLLAATLLTFGAAVALLPAPAVPQVAAPAALRDGQPLKLEIDGRPHEVRIDLERAFTEDLDFRSDSGRLTALGLDQVRKLASRLGRDQRYIVLVSNDNYSPSGRAGRAGFERAKAIRDALVEDKAPGENLIVAGWLSEPSDPGLLSILVGAGRIVIAPVVFATPAAESARGTDLGRTVAFDSATSHVTVATALPAPASTPSPVVIPAPVPSPAPTAVATSAPAPPKPIPSGADLPPAPKPSPTATTAADEPTQPAASAKCKGAADEIDDYYPGGPLVPCGSPYPRHSSH